MWQRMLLSAGLALSAMYLLVNFDEIQRLVDPAKCETAIHVGTLGTINVSRMLGKGAFSLVMKGLAADSGYPVAVKIAISPEAGIKHDEFILSRLNGSSYFPYYYGSGRTRCTSRGGRVVVYPYIVMEQLGKTAGEIAEATPSREDRLEYALEVGTQILNALEEFHSQTGHVFHDLYPMNLAESAQGGNIKLFDFGQIIRMNQFVPDEYMKLNPLYSSLRE